MIKIQTENIGKKFKNEWIFRNLNLEIQNGSPLAVVGPNGSGKSTFMQALAGIIPVNEGKVKFFEDSLPIEEGNWHEYLSFSAPYMELIEEFTLIEAIEFHIKFKKLKNGITQNQFLELIQLDTQKEKTIKNFSSGMRQKLKLGLAFYSESLILLLDEPTANLDQIGFEWYFDQVTSLSSEKLIIISSNEPKEYSFCKNQLNILNFKN